MNYRTLPLWILALLVFSIPFENGVRIGGVGSVSKLVGLAAFAVGVLALVRTGRVKLRSPSLFVVLALLLALWSMASYFWSAVPSATFSTATTMVQLFILVWLVWEFCRTEDDAALLSQAFVLGCCVTIGVALLTFLAATEPNFRNVGDFNPNEFSIIAALGIPLAWWLSLRKGRSTVSWLFMLYPVLALFGVVLAASRGGLLTALVALTIIPISLPRLSLIRRLLLFTVLATATWASFTWIPQLYPGLTRNVERLSSTAEEISEGTLTGRTNIWEAGGDVFVTSPVVGKGFGVFPYMVEPILNAARAPHNPFLSIAVGGGLVGLLIYVSLVIVTFLSVVASNGPARPYFLVLFAALLVGMIPTNSDTDKFAWFLLALMATQRPLVLTTPASRGVVEVDPTGDSLEGYA